MYLEFHDQSFTMSGWRFGDKGQAAILTAVEEHRAYLRGSKHISDAFIKDDATPEDLMAGLLGVLAHPRTRPRQPFKESVAKAAAFMYRGYGKGGRR